MAGVKVVSFISGNGCGKVKTKAIHLHFGRPVTQRVEHQLLNHRIAKIQRITAAGGVVVVTLVILTVVIRIVQAAVGVRKTIATTFCRVVVNDVQDYLYAGSVKFTN